MSRQIDKACELEQFYREQALAAHFDNQLQDGTGVCLSCGEDIDPARLAVNPRFERCVTCQERFEYRKKTCWTSSENTGQ